MNEAQNTTKSTIPEKTSYENNPFFVATTGIDLLFTKAQSIGITLAVMAGLSALWSLPSLFPGSGSSRGSGSTTSQVTTENQKFTDAISSIPTEAWVLGGLAVLVVVLIALTIGFIFKGVSDYTSAHIAAGEKVTLSEALHGVFGGFWGYSWVLFLTGFKVFLWTLLFIIPGFVMSYRYSLAGLAYFDPTKKLRGNAAIKESSMLTKGAWLTTFASQNLLNLLTLGAITSLLVPGTNAVLYRQLSIDEQKPKAHVLSWLTLVIPFVLVLLVMALIGLVVAAVAKNHVN